MSWTDDQRCQYCGGRLPLYRKITQGQFCSSAHRKAYDERHQQLGVERLLETQNLLQRHLPPSELPTPDPSPWQASVAAVPEPNVYEEVPAHEEIFVRQEIPAPEESIAPLVAEILLAPNAKPEALRPGRNIIARAVPEPIVESQALQVVVLEMPPVEAWTPEPATTAEKADLTPTLALQPPTAQVVCIDIDPFAARIAVALPQNELSAPACEPAEEPAKSRRKGKKKNSATSTSASAEVAVQLLKKIPVPLRAVPPSYAEPRVTSLHPLRRPGRPAFPTVQPLEFVESGFIEPGMAAAVNLPTGSAAQYSKPTLTGSDGQVILRVRLASPQMPAIATETLTSFANLCPVPLSAAPVSQPKPGAAKLESLDPHLLVTLPLHDAAPLVDEQLPPMGNLTRLIFKRGEPVSPGAAKGRQILATPMPGRVDARRPRPTFEIAGNLEDLPRGYTPMSAVTASRPTPSALRMLSRVAARREWKALVFVIPVVVAMSFFPTLQRASASTTSTSGFLNQVRQSLAQRAAIALDEDFREGLDTWLGKSGEPADWAYDATGFVQPGDLAVYQPSVQLSDYQLQFLGMIDKKALSWVVRAKDFDNYYVLKLTVTKPGPIPEIVVTRYAVINGHATDRVDTKVHLDARVDTIYRVSMNMRGDDFTLFIQGQMIDTWSDRRLDRGGVGFFTARGEESRVRWVQVTHQYDMIGRLCAYLAPYPISSNGSLEP